MPKIAIDVVLLPPEEIMERAIAINGNLKEDPIQLNKRNCLPHISLCMGVVKEEDLPIVKKLITEIASYHSKLSLTIGRINREQTTFDIKKTDDLQKLHEHIMTALSPYLSYDATTRMCYSPPPVVEKTVFWINNYREKSSFANYFPHITLGISNVTDKKLDIRFTASTLALCHLGNYCTCRKILHAVHLT
ncbi:MAG: hypothetical protein V1743_07295 [Nanoarchaeota archaeon]